MVSFHCIRSYPPSTQGFVCLAPRGGNVAFGQSGYVQQLRRLLREFDTSYGRFATNETS